MKTLKGLDFETSTDFKGLRSSVYHVHFRLSMAQGDRLPDDEKVPPASDKVAYQPIVPGTEADISRWIRNLGAIVTIFVALTGVWLGLYQLRLKADADRDAAKANSNAEQDKLQLGLEQLKDQAKAREFQNKSHDKDLNAEFQKHQLDTQLARDVSADADSRNSAEDLSKLVSHLFSSEGGEGDLASLFEYIDRDENIRQIIKNAVLARLENPRSKEEVDLGFRVLERIGPSAIDITVQANRSARQKYDDCLFERFYETIVKKAAPTDLRGKVMSIPLVESTENETATATPLNHQYALATIDDMIPKGADGYSELLPTEAPQKQCTQPYVSTVILRSNVALLDQLRQHVATFLRDGRTIDPRLVKKLKKLNLDGTYLTSDILYDGPMMDATFSYVSHDKAYLDVEPLLVSLLFAPGWEEEKAFFRDYDATSSRERFASTMESFSPLWLILGKNRTDYDKPVKSRPNPERRRR